MPFLQLVSRRCQVRSKRESPRVTLEKPADPYTDQILVHRGRFETWGGVFVVVVIDVFVCFGVKAIQMPNWEHAFKMKWEYF